jgi:hypothetical protein
MLSVPGGTVGHDAGGGDTKEGFIIIHHDRPISKQSHPGPGMGRFSGAAGGGKQIRAAIHSHSAAMHQEHIPLQQATGDLPLDHRSLQKHIRKFSPLQTFFIGLQIQKPLLLDKLLTKHT